MMEMPYKKPIRKKGVRESFFAHFIKLCWFEVHYKDINNKISRREFCINFKKHVIDTGIIENIEVDYGLSWDFYNEDGSIKTPNYDNDLYCNEWIKKYEWDTQYPIFEANKLMSTPDTEREKYYRNMPWLNQQDYELMETCHEKEKEYLQKEKETGKDMTYYRNKNNETKSQTDERLRKRIGVNEENINIKSENTNNNLNVNITDKEVLDENADTFERFITRRMRKADETDK